MSEQPDSRRRAAAGHLAVAALLAVFGATVAGCSGGGGGGVSIGSGQKADPANVDFPIFYVRRTLPTQGGQLQQDDLTQLRDAVADADLYRRDRAAPSAPERNITARITGDGLYDIRDLEVSADGSRLLFAMRGPLTPNMDERDPPTWNIWEYDIVGDTLHRVIASDILAEEGHDRSPHYLPDGRILFSSTRQKQAKAVLLDEGKPQFEGQTEDRSEPAFVLHVMSAGGGNIRQISFNPSHDIDPTVLRNGRLMWSRWDAAPGGRNGIHLYSSNPDGTDLQLLYGAQSHDTGTNGQTVQFVRARETQNGEILALIRPVRDTDFGGDLVLIDARSYVENHQAVLASAGLQGPAQRRATPNEVRTIPGPSRGGRYASAFPLWDGSNRILVSWSQCRLLDTSVTPAVIVPCTEARLADPQAQSAPPLYSIWMFDPAENTLQPVMQPVEGVLITDVVAAQPRALPTVILDRTAPLDLDPDLVAEGVGVVHIRSVYDFDGTDAATPDYRTLADPRQRTADQRPARFVRIEKAVSLPDRDVRRVAASAFGASGGYMREILGYAPVEPDGSVKLKVPADVAFQISVLDRDARRLFPVHRAWLQVRAGEVVSCNGCHRRDDQNPTSHGRSGLFEAVNRGAATAGQPFPNTRAALSPNAGETMAEAHARISCADTTSRCAAMTPSVSVVYEDVWTDPVAAGRPADAAFGYTYADGSFTTPAPASRDCQQRWSSLCRITIHYEQHIQPLWVKPRQVLDGVTGAVLRDDTCTVCHSPVDPANGQPRVPAGQLDLTAAPSDEQPRQMRSFRELLFTDNEQEVMMGALQDRLVAGPIDPVTGLPTQVTVPVPPSMIAGNARGSSRFFARFAPGGSHAGRLSPAELRLLSEWLDIGAQYFNDPFLAPVD